MGLNAVNPTGQVSGQDGQVVRQVTLWMGDCDNLTGQLSQEVGWVVS